MHIFWFIFLLSAAVLLYKGLTVGTLAVGAKESSIVMVILGIIMAVGGLFFNPWLVMLMVNKWLVYAGINLVLTYWAVFFGIMIATVATRQINSSSNE